MKLLFFSVTKHQYRYFDKLKTHLPFQGEHLFFPSFAFSKKGWQIYYTLELDEIIQTKQKEIELKYSNHLHRWLYEKVLKLQIPWLVSALYGKLTSYKPEYIVIWNGKKFHQAIACEVAKKLHIKPIFFENGVLPNTTTMDFKGVNESNSLPRNASFYEKLHFSDAQRLPQYLIQREAKTKKKIFEETLPQAYIFVPFQVAYDTQIIQHSPYFKNMFLLYETLEWLTKHTSLCFVIKEHPSDRVSDYSTLHKKTNRQIRFSSHDTQTLIENAEAVMTINSSVAVESLLFNKRVIVLGEAFFAIDGIVKMAKNEEEIQAILDTLHSWHPNISLNEKFLKYLYFNYLIPDTWRAPTQRHYDTITERLKGLV